MNKKNELLIFLAGIVLCSVGLFIIFNRVHVGSGFFGGLMGTLSIGRFSFSFWSYSSSIYYKYRMDVCKRFYSSKVFNCTISNTDSRYNHHDNPLLDGSMSMFDWITYPNILIFGGGAMVAKVLFTSHGYDKKQTRKKSNKVNR